MVALATPLPTLVRPVPEAGLVPASAAFVLTEPEVVPPPAVIRGTLKLPTVALATPEPTTVKPSPEVAGPFAWAAKVEARTEAVAIIANR